MNSKTTWSYVAIAGIVFAFIFFVEHPFRERAAASLTTKIFPQFQTNSASHIEVRRFGQWEIQADRTNGSWLLNKPIVYPASPEKIENFLQHLAELEWRAEITAGELKGRPKAQEEFGFTALSASSFLVQQGDAAVNLLIGGNTPVGGQVYLQVVGDPSIYVVDGEFLNSLPRTASDWRDTTLLHIPPSVNVVKSRSGNKGFSLVRTNNSWRMTAPQQAHADDPKVENLLKKTVALEITKFETDDPQADLDAFGLQTPELEIAFATDTNNLVTLQVGRSPTNDPSQVFAKIQNQTHVVRIPKETVDLWRSSPTNFIDRRLISDSLDGVAQIEVRSENKFILQKSGNSWAITNSPALPVDSDLVRDILKLFSRAEVDLEKDPVTDFTSYGLVPPALEYTLRTSAASSNSVVAQITFGTNQSGKVFVRRLDEYPDKVNTIEPGIYRQLPQAEWQFRDRRIWNFSSNEVASVTINQKGRERKIIRNGKGDWAFAPGSQGILNPLAFDEMLYRLGELRAVFWISPDEKELDRFHFKTTDHRISLELKRGEKTEILALEFGGFTEFGTRYAATVLNGKRTVFEFPWPLFFEVQEGLSIPEK